MVYKPSFIMQSIVCWDYFIPNSCDSTPYAVIEILFMNSVLNIISQNYSQLTTCAQTVHSILSTKTTPEEGLYEKQRNLFSTNTM